MTTAVESPSEKYHWKFRLQLAIIPPLFYFFVRMLYRTCRIEVFGKEHDLFVQEKKPLLFVSWHQGLLYYAYHFRDRNGIIMASKSKDAELMVRILTMFGFQSARGSSSRGGKDALHTMIDLINRTGCCGGLVADGPRGPYGIAKIGIIKMAKDTGLPLVPVMVWAKKKILFKSWDRTLLPLPFTRIAFFYEEPIRIPADATPEQMEQARLHLENVLNRMNQKAQAHFGDTYEFRGNIRRK